jgi:hypothetical protein
MRSAKLLSVLALSAGLLGMTAVASHAATETFSLTSDHCDGGCLTGQTSGGTITITDVSAGVVSVNVTLANGNEFVHTGFDTDFGFNLTGAPSITFSGVTTGFTPNGLPNPVFATSLMMDGTGTFEYGVQCTACGNGGSNPQTGPLNFTITATGLTVASFIQNAAGQFFAVDLISGTTGKTGAIDASVVSSVPLPPAALLFGTALVGLGVLGRRRRSNAQG